LSLTFAVVKNILAAEEHVAMRTIAVSSALEFRSEAAEAAALPPTTDAKAGLTQGEVYGLIDSDLSHGPTLRKVI
jgi:hypothetical protein